MAMPRLISAALAASLAGAAAPAPSPLLPASPLPAPPILAPVARSCISSPFGPRRWIGPHAPAAFHRGVDLRAPAGGVVSAVASGRVIGVHRRGPGGLEVAVRHDGYVALYDHLGSVAPALAEGKIRLAAGDRIGVVGRTGVTYGTHLYFEILVNGQAIDPAPLLGLQRCP